MSHDPGYGVNSYQQQEILGESPLGLVARLYEMASLEVARARAAMAAGDWRGKGMAVHQAGRVLSVLQCALDLEKGGDVARNLDRLYGYLIRRLTEAHVQRDDTGFAEIAEHLTELGGAWREAANRERGVPGAADELHAEVAGAAR